MVSGLRYALRDRGRGLGREEMFEELEQVLQSSD